MSVGDYDKQHDIAAEYLASEGIRVLDRDWHGSAHGTAEIVAEEAGTLVLVCAGPGPNPRELEDRTKMRLRRIAVDWMNAHGVRYDKVRVDFISVTLLPMGQSNLEHVRGMAVLRNRCQQRSPDARRPVVILRRPRAGQPPRPGPTTP